MTVIISTLINNNSLQYEIGRTFSDNLLFMFNSNLSYSFFSLNNNNDNDKNLSTNNNLYLIFDSYDNYLIMWNTNAIFDLDWRNFLSLPNTLRFSFNTNLNYKHKISKFIVVIIGNFGNSNYWIYKNDNYQKRSYNGLDFSEIISYEIITNMDTYFQYNIDWSFFEEDIHTSHRIIGGFDYLC